LLNSLFVNIRHFGRKIRIHIRIHFVVPACIDHCWLGWSRWSMCDKRNGQTVSGAACRPMGFWQTGESLESCDCFVHSFIQSLLYMMILCNS